MFRPASASLLRLRLRFFVELDGRADGDGERWLDGFPPRGAGDFDPSAELRLGDREPRERGVGGVRAGGEISRRRFCADEDVAAAWRALRPPDSFSSRTMTLEFD